MASWRLSAVETSHSNEEYKWIIYPYFTTLKAATFWWSAAGKSHLRKVRLVQQASALITIVAKDFCPDLLAMDADDKTHGCNGL